MILNDQFRPQEVFSETAARSFHRDGTVEDVTSSLMEEHLMDIYINDVLTMKVVCTPEHLPELVLGRLRTEGIIRDPEEIDLLYICEFGSRAKVMLKATCEQKEGSREAEAAPYVETTPSCCTSNHILTDLFSKDAELVPVQPIHWEPRWVFQMADRFFRGTPLHRKTRAAHSCFLARGADILFGCEDLGRHNALDKAVGYALRQGIPLEECLLFTSGRIPLDMTEKAIRAGVPVLISKADPTGEAVALARQFNLTILGAAHEDRFRQYTAPGDPGPEH